MEAVYIGLGSNLAEPIKQLTAALDAMREIPESCLKEVSAFYSSAPLGPADQPRYLNAVARLDTQLEALALLDALQQIEQQQGRVRTGERWGPRTLDLDIILFGTECIENARLQIPHYHCQARAFVLYPLAELVAKDFVLPDGRKLQQLLADCPAEGLEQLTERYTRTDN